MPLIRRMKGVTPGEHTSVLLQGILEEKSIVSLSFKSNNASFWFPISLNQPRFWPNDLGPIQTGLIVERSMSLR